MILPNRHTTFSRSLIGLGSVIIHFPDSLKKSLADVNQFHHDMVNDRTTRFLKQKAALLAKVEDVERKMAQAKKNLESKLQYLYAHQLTKLKKES